jgi:hypothetical protein
MPLSLTYGRTKKDISIDVSNFLSVNSLDIADRTALIFMLKSDKLAADVDAEYNITEGADLSVSGNVITARINDFSSISVGPTYFIGLGIQFAGDTQYREIPLGTGDIIFTQDVIRG